MNSALTTFVIGSLLLMHDFSHAEEALKPKAQIQPVRASGAVSRTGAVVTRVSAAAPRKAPVQAPLAPVQTTSTSTPLHREDVSLEEMHRYHQ